MHIRYAVSAALVALLLLAPTAAHAQATSFESAESCTPNCNPGTTAFDVAGLSFAVTTGSPAGIVASGAGGACTALDQCYSIGGTNQITITIIGDTADDMTFQWFSGTGTATAFDESSTQVCQSNKNSSGSTVTVTWTPGVTANCTSSNPIKTVTIVGAAIDDVAYTPTSLPVELTAFDALTDQADVVLRWQTASETNNAGFEIQRRLGEAYQALGFVNGQGTTSETQRYQHRLADLAPGRHTFRLKQVDFDGAFAYSPTVEVVVELPDAYALSAAYPNPFNPQTRFTLSVRETQPVRVSVFNLLGREVVRLHDGPLSAGTVHDFTIDGAGLPSGVYLYKVEGTAFRTSRPVTLLK